MLSLRARGGECTAQQSAGRARSLHQLPRTPGMYRRLKLISRRRQWRTHSTTCMVKITQTLDTRQLACERCVGQHVRMERRRRCIHLYWLARQFEPFALKRRLLIRRSRCRGCVRQLCHRSWRTFAAFRLSEVARSLTWQTLTDFDKSLINILQLTIRKNQVHQSCMWWHFQKDIRFLVNGLPKTIIFLNENSIVWAYASWTTTFWCLEIIPALKFCNFCMALTRFQQR